MIVSCPSCSSRYRIRDEKVSDRGARITCPSCTHKFVVHREEEAVGVGMSGARGVPVAFARGGRRLRAEGGFEEDDEAEVPTTVMPHGSQLAESIRLAAAAKAQKAALNREPEPPSDAGVAAGAADLRSLRSPTRGELQSAPPPRRLGRAVGFAMVGFVGVALVVAALVALGVVDFPLPAVGG